MQKDAKGKKRLTVNISDLADLTWRSFKENVTHFSNFLPKRPDHNSWRVTNKGFIVASMVEVVAPQYASVCSYNGCTGDPLEPLP